MGRLACHKQKMEESIKTLLTELADLREEYSKEQRRAKDVSHKIRSFRSELMEAVQFIQEPEKLRVCLFMSSALHFVDAWLTL